MNELMNKKAKTLILIVFVVVVSSCPVMSAACPFVCRLLILGKVQQVQGVALSQTLIFSMK